MTILLREQEQVIALKTEVTYGTDATPAGADALLVHDISVRALEGDVAELNNLVGFLGHQGSARINTYCSVEFSIYLHGSGTVDEPPAYNSVYAISSHNETITALASVDYSLASANQDSGSIYYLVGEHQHAILGVRGSLTWEFSTTGLPKLRFRGLGLYVAPVKVVGGLAGVSFAGVLKPLEWTQETVPTCTLHGTALNAMSVTIDQAMAPEFLPLIAQEEIVQSSRKSTLQAKFREDDVATKNWFEVARANTRGAFALQHGVDATHDGRIFEFAAPAVEVANVERSFEKGIAMLTLNCNLVATAKGNEYTFAHR